MRLVASAAAAWELPVLARERASVAAALQAQRLVSPVHLPAEPVQVEVQAVWQAASSTVCRSQA